jgi:hypothetical protein
MRPLSLLGRLRGGTSIRSVPWLAAFLASALFHWARLYSQKRGKFCVNLLAPGDEFLDAGNAFVEHWTLLRLVDAEVRVSRPLPRGSENERRWQRGFFQRRQ